MPRALNPSSGVLRVEMQPKLIRALAKAAKAEGLSLSAFVRLELASALEERAAAKAMAEGTEDLLTRCGV